MLLSPISARQHLLTVAKIINKIALRGGGGALLVLVEELNIAGAGITDKTNNIEIENSRIVVIINNINNVHMYISMCACFCMFYLVRLMQSFTGRGVCSRV